MTRATMINSASRALDEVENAHRLDHLEIATVIIDALHPIIDSQAKFDAVAEHSILATPAAGIPFVALKDSGGRMAVHQGDVGWRYWDWFEKRGATLMVVWTP